MDPLINERRDAPLGRLGRRSSGTSLLLIGAMFVRTPSTTLALSQTWDLKGEVLNEQNKPVAGAICTLSGGMLLAEGLSERTAETGGFQFSSLVPGDYVLTCAADGYQPISKSDLKVGDAASPFVQFVLPRETVRREEVEVREKAPAISEQQAAQPAKLSSSQLLTLPLVEQKFRAALPLLPSVVRTPDGRINIKGLSEGESLLLVDSAQTSDPITGSFAIDVPSVAIESLSVNKNAYRAEYGGFSGAVTSVQTRAPSGQWHFEAQNIPPNPRIKGGHLVGIADFNPRFYVTGPLIANKVNFSESLAYDVDKLPVRGLPFPYNEIKTQDINSLTSFQFIFSPQHLVAASVNVFPLRRQFANINSLVPQAASSDYGQKGFSIAVTDRHQWSSGAALTTLVQTTRFLSNAHGQGPQDMLVTPEGWNGNFFNTYHRTSNQEEALENFGLPQKYWHGKHELTLGGDFRHRSYRGTNRSHPVLLLRPDGTVAERVDFSGSGALGATNTEAALFAQDQWVFTDRLALDAGLRYSGQTLGDWADLAPRLGVTYALGTDGKTVLRSGVGLFNDRVPLLAGDFTGNPTRIVSFFGEHGMLEGPPLVFQNEYLRVGEGGRVTMPSTRHLNSTPLNVTWNIEADRQFLPNVQLRMRYVWSQTADQFIVDPRHQPGADAFLVLTNTGGARYQEFESTLHARPTESSELNVSYVHSQARGDLNTLGQVYVPFEEPVIRPNFFGNLPSDIPHRLIAWGRFSTRVWGIFASPFLDYHSGFPYSTVDVLQNYVDPPNTKRFPRFFSLDLKLGRDFRLPLLWLKKYRLRGSLTTLNLTNNFNPRDVFSNIASPNFGHFVGFQHRFFDTELDVIY